MPLVSLHHLLNVSVQLANKGDSKQKEKINYRHLTETKEFQGWCITLGITGVLGVFQNEDP
jgi:hypothetical protein